MTAGQAFLAGVLTVLVPVIVVIAGLCLLLGMQTEGRIVNHDRVPR